MESREFFKPTMWKIISTLIVFILLALLIFVLISSNSGEGVTYVIFAITMIPLTIFGGSIFRALTEGSFIPGPNIFGWILIIIFYLIFIYLIVSIIALIIHKFRKPSV